MKRLMLSLFMVFGFLLVAAPAAVHAEDVFSTACQGNAGASAVCTTAPGATENPLTGPDGLITRVTQMIVVLVAVIAVIVIIISGLRYILSSGDAGKVSSAKDTILYAVIGLVVAAFGQVIVSFVLNKL